MTQGTKYDSATSGNWSAADMLSATSDKFQFIDLRNSTNDTTSGTGTVGTDVYADHNMGTFVISNTADGSEVITIRGWNGSSATGTICTPTQNETAIVHWTGNDKGWIGIAGSDA